MWAVNLGSLLTSLGLTTLATAWASPGYSGYTLQWESQFAYAAGQPPSSDNWNIITGYLGVNAVSTPPHPLLVF